MLLMNIDLKILGKNMFCYECGKEATELSYNSRCMSCMNSRDKVNQDYIDDPCRSPLSAFQGGVDRWMKSCFGEKISSDAIERNHRFLEESLELVQACDCTKSEAQQLVEYVFNRPIGEKKQEVGGVMVTLSALCSAQKINMLMAGNMELDRIWLKIPEIKTKQASKPKHSPLPGDSKNVGG